MRRVHSVKKRKLRRDSNSRLLPRGTSTAERVCHTPVGRKQWGCLLSSAADDKFYTQVPFQTKITNKADSLVSQHWLPTLQTQKTRTARGSGCCLLVAQCPSNMLVHLRDRKRSGSESKPESKSTVSNKSWTLLRIACTNGWETVASVEGFLLLLNTPPYWPSGKASASRAEDPCIVPHLS